ncbi:MAG: hypothetical protein HFH81_06595 [Lachnospiraceae bacterium]|jgi:hypothetical protein|nr:hypothetical protein [Lachnospiraceae bacterium]
MKKMNITWDGIYDSTGYLFSFAKALCCAVKNSPFAEAAEEIVASSGFAFRMWVSPDLCPSATSMWQFDRQKNWVERGGISCQYIERMWGQEDVEEERRQEAVQLIRQSIDSGIPVISWDIVVCEWGLITGYDDESETFAVLPITGQEGEMAYSQLGKREIPILSVLAVTGKAEQSQEEIVRETLDIAKNHLLGNEWCENACGLAAYPALVKHLESEEAEMACSWNMEYFLGTYAPLKWYAWKFFERHGLQELASLYHSVYENWQKAFEMKKSLDLSDRQNRQAVAELLKQAEVWEKQAVDRM